TRLSPSLGWFSKSNRCREGRYRRIERWEEAPPLPLDRENAASIRIAPAERGLTRDAYGWVGHDRVGIEMYAERALSAVCGRQHYLAFFSRSLVDDPRRRLLEHSHLAAIVAQKTAEDGSFTVRWLAMTAPKPGSEVACALFRLDGNQVMRGAIRDDKLVLAA